MFTTHFKMTDHPFPATLPLGAIQRDQRFCEALARLQFFLDFDSCALVTGDEGVGKSSLIRLFIDSLTKKRFLPVYLHLTQLKPTAFLKMFVHALGEKPALTKDRVLIQILAKINTLDDTIICIIDEAHLLDPGALVDMRLLLSGAPQAEAKLKLLLVGHPQLKKDLRRSCHTALAQRITVRYNLPSFSLQQTIDYIDFHLSRVGVDTKLFDDDVKKEIHEHARGVPRLINNIATACLIAATTLNAQKITREIFSHATHEFQLYA